MSAAEWVYTCQLVAYAALATALGVLWLGERA